ncbi:hypothetical protein [Barnesiella intestinihominis]|uniref:hypothetical protein n=1 Tax=Barnesiella intestinihominis TaxID=487174 RepID=UPI003970FEAA
MPSLWKAYKNQYRVVPLQQMTVFQPESDGQGKYRVMESCLNYSCLERQSLSLSIFFVRFYFTELGEACPVAELPDITYTSRLRYFTPTDRKSRRSRYCDSRCSIPLFITPMS